MNYYLLGENYTVINEFDDNKTQIRIYAKFEENKLKAFFYIHCVHISDGKALF